MSATSEVPAAYRNTAGEAGVFRLVREGIDDVRSRRRLVRYLVLADVRKRGADTLLGNLWWVIDPLLQMVVYVVLVTLIARGRTIPDYPLFIFAAILPWKWFTVSVSDGTASVSSQDKLIKQIAFPKLVLPVASVTAGIVGFLFGLIPLIGVMLFYPDRLTPYVLLVPVIAVVQYLFTLAFVLVVAAGNVFFRDLGNVMRHLLRLWFYLSPGLYSLTVLESTNLLQHHSILRTLFLLNPFAVLFEAYRTVIWGTSPDGPPTFPAWGPLIALTIASLGFLAIATVVFKRLEPNFAKVL